MKYILHFKDGHDEIHQSEVVGIGMFYDAEPEVESWETWYPEWQGNEPVKEAEKCP